MENNMEFRIWDKNQKVWLRVFHEVGLNNKKLTTPNYFLDCTGRVCWPVTGMDPIMAIPDQSRYEVSQYIGRKDSAGVKAFTGDRITCKTVNYEGEYAEFKLKDGFYGIEDRNGAMNMPFDFTIIGNKWEGLRAAEAITPIEPVCDSAVQQQNKDAMEKFKDNAESWRKEYNASVSKENELPPFDFELRQLKEDHVQWWREHIKRPIYQMTAEFFNQQRFDEAKDFVAARIRENIKKYPIEQDSESLKEAKEEYLKKQLPGIKSKQDHEADRLRDLTARAMYCKFHNQPPDIGLITEINELLTWKVDTRTAQ